MPRPRTTLLLGIVAVLSIGVAVAQFRGGGRRFWRGDSGPIIQTEGGELVNEETVRTARQTAQHSAGFPEWTNAPAFVNDTFTFARIIFKSAPGRPSWLGWVNDYPDADLNLSYRLQQLTSLKVNPDGRVLKLTSPDLGNYPMIFAAQAGGMELADEEASALRKYLLAGGVFVADDFWGERDWENFEFQIGKVLPGRTWTELPMEHPLFHCVYELSGPKSRLQVPTIHLWRRSYNPDDPQSFSSGFRGEGSHDMHVRVWFDDHQRIMIVALHNTDTGDGWEREGEDEVYFRTFSETRAYPLAINIIFYVMTH